MINVTPYSLLLTSYFLLLTPNSSLLIPHSSLQRSCRLLTPNFFQTSSLYPISYILSPISYFHFHAELISIRCLRSAILSFCFCPFSFSFFCVHEAGTDPSGSSPRVAGDRTACGPVPREGRQRRSQTYAAPVTVIFLQFSTMIHTPAYPSAVFVRRDQSPGRRETGPLAGLSPLKTDSRNKPGNGCFG